MKRYVTAIILLAALIALAGCTTQYGSKIEGTQNFDDSKPAVVEETSTVTTTPVPAAPKPAASASGLDPAIFSDKACKWSSDCDSSSEYKFCILNHCAKPTQALKDYIAKNYKMTDCGKDPCETCGNGQYIGGSASLGDFEISFCTECDSNDGMWPCKEGYTCNLAKCVKK